MNTEEKYIKGFNHGYILAEYEPVLLAQMVKTLDSKNEYVEGIIAGKEELELEKSRTHLDELTQLRNKSQDRDKGLERE